MASLALLIIATFVGISEEIAVMSIDLGSEWMKVAIVSVRDISVCSESVSNGSSILLDCLH